MNCREVEKRLVALDDGELAPGEATRVGEHLVRCGRCRERRARLGAATPRPALYVPPPLSEEMSRRLDARALRRLARDRSPRPSWTTTFLRREARLPAGALVAYALVLVVAVAWGMSNWMEARSLELALESQQTAPVEVVPAEQFLPASWEPESEEDDLF